MYVITSDGERVALCEAPRYIKVNPVSGCYIQADMTEAQGIAVLGQPYNLPGHTEIMREVFIPTEGGEEGEGTVERQVAPVAEVERVDDYAFLKGLEDKNSSQDDEITNNELALCEIYEMMLG